MHVFIKKILDVLKVDDKRFSVQINMYFGVFWTEERLKMPKTTNLSESSGWLPIDVNFMTHLWVPNVFVYNLVAFEILECLQKLSGLWVVGKQDLFYNQVIFFFGFSVKLFCSIDITFFNNFNIFNSQYSIFSSDNSCNVHVSDAL